MRMTKAQRRGARSPREGCAGPCVAGRFSPPGVRGRAGQSLVESCLAIAIICLVLMGMLQVALLFSAREIIFHAAASGARAKTVGFNAWMVTKVVRVAGIPNAGRLVEPADYVHPGMDLPLKVRQFKPGEIWDQALQTQPVAHQFEDVERPGIPEYLELFHDPLAHRALDYTNWDSIVVTDGLPLNPPDPPADPPPLLRFAVEQAYPLWAPLHRAFFASDNVRIGGECTLENHYPLYIDDQYR
jgi:hypothetical protein